MTRFMPYWLAAANVLTIQPRLFRQWLAHFSDIEGFFKAPLSVWQSLGIRDSHINALQAIPWDVVEQDMAWGACSGQHIITIEDEDYPKLLIETPDPPLVLYVKGSKSALHIEQIAVIGSRRASPIGLQNARRFASELAEAGLAVTSGLAQGVDSASHRGALAVSGVTVAVVGSGLSHCYPPSNRHLMEEIADNQGAVVSEFPLSTRPHAFHFPRRNRIISGLSQGVLVVEAALKSGSLITVKHALEQGREVFAIPGSIHQPLARGCHYLIRQGAKLVETASDILEELPYRGGTLKQKKKRRHLQNNDIPEHCRIVFDQIETDATSIDTIILQSRLTPGEVSSILLLLELGGYIQAVTGGYVRIEPST